MPIAPDEVLHSLSISPHSSRSLRFGGLPVAVVLDGTWVGMSVVGL